MVSTKDLAWSVILIFLPHPPLLSLWCTEGPPTASMKWILNSSDNHIHVVFITKIGKLWCKKQIFFKWIFLKVNAWINWTWKPNFAGPGKFLIIKKINLSSIVIVCMPLSCFWLAQICQPVWYHHISIWLVKIDIDYGEVKIIAEKILLVGLGLLTNIFWECGCFFWLVMKNFGEQWIGENDWENKHQTNRKLIRLTFT